MNVTIRRISESNKMSLAIANWNLVESHLNPIIKGVLLAGCNLVQSDNPSYEIKPSNMWFLVHSKKVEVYAYAIITHWEGDTLAIRTIDSFVRGNNYAARLIKGIEQVTKKKLLPHDVRKVSEGYWRKIGYPDKVWLSENPPRSFHNH